MKFSTLFDFSKVGFDWSEVKINLIGKAPKLDISYYEGCLEANRILTPYYTFDLNQQISSVFP
jgi:hypothetical protein